MLTVVKNQLRVMLLSVKYNVVREMTNRVTFLTNVIFMILNNASFIIQWLIFFQIKETIGGYTMNDVMLLWGIAASTYGFSFTFFKGAYSLPKLIMNGKIDAFLVQPKDVLLGISTSETKVSAIGDLLYGYIILCIFHFSLYKLLMFTLFTITGGIIITAFAIIIGSLGFYIVKADAFADSLNGIMTNIATYPDQIFQFGIKVMMYTVLPVGFSAFLPLRTMLNFNLIALVQIFGFTILITLLAFFVFYRGLRKYSSSNLMSARI